jgi:hypothetical protein
MSSVSMKNQFCDSGFEVLEKSGITSVVWCDEIPTLKLTVVDPADERVVEVNVVRITYDVDLEVIHNLPVIAKTNYSSAIRSLQDSSNMKKCPSSVLPQTVSCSVTMKGLMATQIQSRERSPLIGITQLYPLTGI